MTKIDINSITNDVTEDYSEYINVIAKHLDVPALSIRVIATDFAGEDSVYSGNPPVWRGYMSEYIQLLTDEVKPR